MTIRGCLESLWSMSRQCLSSTDSKRTLAGYFVEALYGATPRTSSVRTADGNIQARPYWYSVHIQLLFSRKLFFTHPVPQPIAGLYSIYFKYCKPRRWLLILIYHHETDHSLV